MKSFDNEPPSSLPSPESFEDMPRTIIKYPALEIDTDAPSRVPQNIIENFTTVRGSKLVAEIKTPLRELLLLNMDVPECGTIVMVVDSFNASKRQTIGMGEDLDVSDFAGDGKCIVTVSLDGRVFVNAVDVDTEYLIYTTSRDQYVDQAPAFEDSYDDPEY